MEERGELPPDMLQLQFSSETIGGGGAEYSQHIFCLTGTTVFTAKYHKGVSEYCKISSPFSLPVTREA